MSTVGWKEWTITKMNYAELKFYEVYKALSFFSVCLMFLAKQRRPRIMSTCFANQTRRAGLICYLTINEV